MSLLKKIAFFLTGILLTAVLIIGLGSYLSLDRQFSHTAQTAELPLFDGELLATDEPLVRLSANGFEFRARIAGFSNDGPLVILLHGFPATSAMWRPIIPVLDDEGYRVIAFDQRGYSPGARPLDAKAYAVPNLVADVLAIADAVETEKFHLVGHDWGSAVGWSTVLEHSERILSWTGLSIPHPTAFSEALQNDADQQSRSGYFSLFTTPLVPEILLTFNDLALLTAAYEGMDQANIDEYRAVFSEPRALTSALNWYRQMDDLVNRSVLSPQTTVPTLFIWGNNDAAVGRAAVESQSRFMIGPYQEVETDAEHWLLTTHASEIMPVILEHIGGID